MISISKFIIFLLIFFCTHLHSATIAVSKSGSLNSCSDNLFVIEGEITKGDASRLTDLLKQVMSKYHDGSCSDGWVSIQLNSSGGDVFEAFKVGRVIRANNLRTIVPMNSSCHSSCIFLLAGGVRRIPIGNVGIHRPYFTSLDNNLSPTEIQIKRKDLNKKISEFLEEMDVSQSILDKMLAIPPEKIRILSPAELTDYRLSIDDASFEEKLVASLAAKYNLSSAEYRKRDSDADRSCRYLSKQEKWQQWTICRESVLIQISNQEAKNRLLKFTDKCGALTSRLEIDQCFKRIVVNAQ